MEKPSETSDKINQLLGKIFYSAAMADRVIKEEEVSKLNDIISKSWKYEEELILKSFYSCINLGYNTAQLPVEINAQKTVDPELFSKKLIERIVKTAYDVVNATSGTNKSEVVFISQLRMELER